MSRARRSRGEIRRSGRGPLRDGPRVLAGLEVAAMASLLLSYIWGWQDAFPGHFGILLVLFATLAVSSHWRKGETPGAIGLGFERFGPALWLATKVLGPVLAVVLLGGVLAGTAALPSLEERPIALAQQMAWGTVQQYGLACFFYRRWLEILPRAALARMAAAAVFAVCHLPNPFLTPVTLAGGYLSCWIYDRAPNLWALGIAHGLVGVVLARAIPHGVTGGMRVGPGYLRFVAG